MPGSYNLNWIIKCALSDFFFGHLVHNKLVRRLYFELTGGLGDDAWEDTGQVIRHHIPWATFVNVMDRPYRAAADGQHDDSNAIRLALATEQDIWFPVGTYLYDGITTEVVRAGVHALWRAQTYWYVSDDGSDQAVGVTEADPMSPSELQRRLQPGLVLLTATDTPGVMRATWYNP